MSEPLARARRVVAVGAAALAVVIVALAAAAWRLVEAETASAAVRGQGAAAMAADDLIRTLVGRHSFWFTTLTPTGVVDLLGGSFPPSGFDPMPPPTDAAAAFFVREAAGFSSELERAALRRATGSSDPVARVTAAAAGVRLELRERTGHESDWALIDVASLGKTRDGVLIGLFRDERRLLNGFIGMNVQIVDQRAYGALAMIGGPDDVEASAMLATVFPDGLHRARERRREVADWNRAVAALRNSVVIDDRFRGAFLSDGRAVVAKHEGESWKVDLASATEVTDACAAVLVPRELKLVRRDAATSPAAVPLAGEEAWAIVAKYAQDETRSRSTLLVVGLGVAAGAAVLAFAAFARSAQREARLAALRTDFVATVSHELRTPVAVVRTSAETLASGRATRAEDKQALTEAIVRESERLSSLVGNVLDFARMESGRRTYAMRTTDVGALVRDVASRHVGVTVEIADDVPSIACDADALGGAVGNLLDNARKYSSPDAPVVVRVARRGGDVVVDVEDHGIGVPDAEKRHVFERFFRGADPRVRDTRGAGIGLALVQHAAQAHGGRVDVVDTPGGGATFRIALPIAQNG